MPFHPLFRHDVVPNFRPMYSFQEVNARLPISEILGRPTQQLCALEYGVSNSAKEHEQAEKLTFWPSRSLLLFLVLKCGLMAQQTRYAAPRPLSPVCNRSLWVHVQRPSIDPQR